MSEKTDIDEATEKDEKPGWKARLGKLTGWVNGPYRAVAFAVLLVVLVLFGRDVLSTLSVGSDIRRLREQKQELLRSIASDSTLLKNLDDPEFLERYARERYLMRREGDEVYIINNK